MKSRLYIIDVATKIPPVALHVSNSKPRWFLFTNNRKQDASSAVNHTTVDFRSLEHRVIGCDVLFYIFLFLKIISFEMLLKVSTSQMRLTGPPQIGGGEVWQTAACYTHLCLHAAASQHR